MHLKLCFPSNLPYLCHYLFSVMHSLERDLKKKQKQNTRVQHPCVDQEARAKHALKLCCLIRMTALVIYLQLYL